MGLDAQVQQDILAIRTNLNDFSTAVTFTAPTSPQITTIINCKVNKHHLVFDEMGMVKANVLNASVSLSMLSLNDAKYPYRDAANRVTLKGHLVTWADILGVQTYAVNEWYPGEVTGLLVLILGEYAS